MVHTCPLSRTQLCRLLAIAAPDERYLCEYCAYCVNSESPPARVAETADSRTRSSI